MSLMWTSQGRSRSCALISRQRFVAIRLCSRLTPAIAKIDPSKYSCLTGDFRSRARYCSGVYDFFTAADDMASSSTGNPVRRLYSTPVSKDRPAAPEMLGLLGAEEGT